LPDPEYRHLAGHVRRKTGGAVRATPPPSHPQQTSSTPRNRPPNQRKKGSNRFGNGSGSDSDSDSDPNRKLRRNGDGISGARRRPAKPSDASEPLLPNRAAIEREESERMKLFRVLQEVTDKWGRIRHRRRENQEAGDRREQLLLRRYAEMRGQCSTSLEYPGAVTRVHRLEVLQESQDDWQDSGWMSRMVCKIEKWEANRRCFLDEVLYGDIEKKLLEEEQCGMAPGKPSVHLEAILGRVESDVISRCHQFDPSTRDWGLSFPSLELRLVAIVKALYQGLWIHLSQPGNEAADLVAATAAFVEENCPDRSLFRDNEALTDAYMAKIIEGLVEAALRDRSTAQRNPNPESLRLVRIIRESRNDGHMTSAYMGWICSDVEANVVEQCCVQWEKGRKAEAVEKLRSALRSIIQQEFCPNIIRPGVVSLVLLKADIAQTVRNVSEGELMEIGWFSQSPQFLGSKYWRYELCSRGLEDTILKVSMAHEILGMWMPNGKFLGWDESMGQNPAKK